MLRFTTRNKTRISSRLAFFAALALVVSTLAGMDESLLDAQQGAGQLSEMAMTSVDQPNIQKPAVKTLNKSKAFKMSLFLFRLN
jgi:hypothetical protein